MQQPLKTVESFSKKDVDEDERFSTNSVMPRMEIHHKILDPSCWSLEPCCLDLKHLLRSDLGAKVLDLQVLYQEHQQNTH